MTETRTAVDLRGQAAKWAHEIRNPLHAMRLNLHALRLATKGQCQLTADEVETLIAESEQSISRVDQLMREILEFALPAAADDRNSLTQE